MSPSSTVYGGQHDTKYVTFELLLHAAFVADEIWGFMLEPARTLKRICLLQTVLIITNCYSSVGYTALPTEPFSQR